MNETSCLSDLLEKGIQKMGEMHLRKAHSEIFTFDRNNNLSGCCAIGAILLGMGVKADSSVPLPTALGWISEVCPNIHKATPYTSIDYGDDETPDELEPLDIGDLIWHMNDGDAVIDKDEHLIVDGPEPLNVILDWLKSQGL